MLLKKVEDPFLDDSPYLVTLLIKFIIQGAVVNLARRAEAVGYRQYLDFIQSRIYEPDKSLYDIIR